MKVIEWFLALLLVAKATVAITEQPKALFDALHESGEAREVAEQTRMQVEFFAEAAALVQRSAFVWMAARVLEVVLPESRRNRFITFMKRMAACQNGQSVMDCPCRPA